MKLTLKLNLNVLVSAIFDDNFYLDFDDIKSVSNWFDEEESGHVTRLEFQKATTYRTMYVFFDGSSDPSYDERDGDLITLSATENYIILYGCTIADSSFNRVIEFINKGIIELDVEGRTSLYAYRLNDEKDKINKTLTPITIFNGSFKAPLGIKNIELDVVDYDISNSYNYVFIPKLNRYYYITNIQLTNKDYTRLILQEDVLMSWKNLILSQSAFVSRYENSTENLLVDTRRPLKDISEVEYISISTTSLPNLINCTLNFNLGSGTRMYLVSTTSDKVFPNRNSVDPPSNSGLPYINNVYNRSNWIVYMTQDQISTFYSDLFRDDTASSFVSSIILLPFNPSLPIDDLEDTVTYVNDKVFCSSGFYKVDEIPEGDAPIVVKRSLKGASRYFVIDDFTYSIINPTYLDFEPYTNLEIFVPFVGWVQLQIKQIMNKRVIVYYTMDNITGSGTAYIYNLTDQKLIWSSNCQLGIKMTLTTSNALEIERQKEASQLNLIMGMLSSAVSIGVGVASENPVAIVGGVLSGTKALSSFVNTNRQLFQRGQTTFGTGEGSLHAPNRCQLRRTYNEAINISETTYKHLNGLPYNNYLTSLQSLTGYIEVGDIHFNAMGENIYNDEITEIVQLLKNGVIL